MQDLKSPEIGHSADKVLNFVGVFLKNRLLNMSVNCRRTTDILNFQVLQWNN